MYAWLHGYIPGIVCSYVMLALSSPCMEAAESHNLSLKYGHYFVLATVRTVYLFKQRLKENTLKHNLKVTCLKRMLINVDKFR